MSRPLEPEGVAFLHGRESCRLQAYDDYDGTPLVRDVGGVWRRPDGAACLRFPTIGWGQRVWGPKYYGPCMLADADAWFAETVADHCAAVDRQCPDANKYQRGALVSFSYNCGTGALVPSGIVNAHKKFQSGELSADDLKKFWTSCYIKSAGVVEEGLRVRRAREVAFYLTPVATIPDTPEVSPEEALNRAYALASQIVAEFV